MKISRRKHCQYFMNNEYPKVKLVRYGDRVKPCIGLIAASFKEENSGECLADRSN